MIIGNRNFDTEHHTYVMGILNVTPDSFSDGGNYTDIDVALKQVGQMIADGADIIDVGGESTRPGYVRISDEEEIERVAPVIERITREYDIPVSLDTYKSKVASAGISAGADLINDIWGLKADSAMADVIAANKVACCLMHNREEMDYQSFVDDVVSDLKQSVKLALEAGVDRDKIMLDPGVGFAKDVKQNLKIIQRMDSISELGYPVLLGTSRKSVIGLTLDVPVGERLEGTLATTVWAVMNNIAFVRVHDVLSNVRAVKMAEAIRDI